MDLKVVWKNEEEVKDIQKAYRQKDWGQLREIVRDAFRFSNLHMIFVSLDEE